MAHLPSIIPIFPLPNLVLFPGVGVPLHIFEPRYRQMIADVADQDGVIGMVLLKGEWKRNYNGFPDIYSVGCAGRISNLVRLPDGRFNLILEGVGEFRIQREIRERPYRQAEVEWSPARDDDSSSDAEVFASLREALFEFLGSNAREAWQSLVEERGLGFHELINFLSFHLDISPLEKQTLLEAMDGRASCLVDVLTFNIENRRRGGQGEGTVN
jgi:hypothetical protein